MKNLTLEDVVKLDKNFNSEGKIFEAFFSPSFKKISELKSNLIKLAASKNYRKLVLSRKSFVIEFDEFDESSSKFFNFKKKMDDSIKSIFIASNLNRKNRKHNVAAYAAYEGHSTLATNEDIFFLNETVIPFINGLNELNKKDLDLYIEKTLNVFIESHQVNMKKKIGYSYDKAISILNSDEDLLNEFFCKLNYRSFSCMKKYKTEELSNLTNPELNSVDPDVVFIGSYQDKKTDISYHILTDCSIIAEKGNVFKAIHPLQIKPLFARFEFEYLKNTFKKSPMIIKEILNKCGDDEFGLYPTPNTLKKIENFSVILKENRNVIKHLKIDVIDLFKEHYSIEGIVDHINKESITNKARQSMKSYLNTKTHYLLTDENVDIFESFNDKKVSREDLQNHVFNNIGYYQLKGDESGEKIEENLKSFSYSLNSFKNKMNYGFDTSYYINKMEENDHSENIIFNQDGILIYKVETAEESLLYGNNTWCISRENSYKTYFHDYKKENKNQYFYYNEGAENSEERMIGITTDKHGIPTDSFNNGNRFFLDNPKLKDIASLIQENDKTIKNKIKNIKKKSVI